MTPKPNPSDDRPSIRQAALVIIGGTTIVGIGMAAAYGTELPFGVAGHALSGFGGFIAWWCYHGISRRNDGMLIPLMVHPTRLIDGIQFTVAQELRARLVRFGVAVVIACVLGSYLRITTWAKTKPLGEPLFDMEIDRQPIR